MPGLRCQLRTNNMKIILEEGVKRRLFLERTRAKINSLGNSIWPQPPPMPCIVVVSAEYASEYAFEVEICGPSKFVHDLTATQAPAAWVETEAGLILTMDLPEK